MAELVVRYSTNEAAIGVQSYDLKVVVTNAVGMSDKIFVFQRTVNNPSDAQEEDRFICIADPVDLEEFPEDSPDIGNDMPYYRLSQVTLRFRDMVTLEETKELIELDIQQLVYSINVASTVTLFEEVTYGPTSYIT